MLKLYTRDGDHRVVLYPITMRNGARRCLVRLPKNIDRLELVVRDDSDLTEFLDLSITETGKLQLLAAAARHNPRVIAHGLRNGYSADTVKVELLRLFGYKSELALSTWFENYRYGFDYTSVRCNGSATFSIVMPVYKVKPEWLQHAIESVVRQTYANWELICVDDFSQSQALTEILQAFATQDKRITVLSLDKNVGVSAATNIAIEAADHEFIVLMDHDDVLEPHALARFADAAASEGADLLYADELITSEDIDGIVGVQARPQYSPVYYLSNPYFVHPVAVKRSLVEQVGGFNRNLRISQDVDFMHRVLEHVRTVTHIPDLLYRWRTVHNSTGHTRRKEVMAASRAVKTEHLRRIGFPDAVVTDGPSFNIFSTRYRAKPKGRVLAIIPTKNQFALLRLCIESLRRTTAGLDLDLAIVDHQSDDPRTVEYLASLAASGDARIVSFQGPFNYSAINNKAVATCGAGYDHFLFLNNDIEARAPGWLDAMVDLADTPGIGVVGSTLLYPNGTVQHGGVIVGMRGVAEHVFKFVPFKMGGAHRAALHATREYSAVTAACMLVPSPVFHQVGGFDETLAVGFNDTDLCLRIGYAGFKVVNCADAVLIHHESASRGKSHSGGDPHPEDSALFRQRHRAIIENGDAFFSPLLSREHPEIQLDPLRRLSATVAYRTWRKNDLDRR